jgi:hypothetical protein
MVEKNKNNKDSQTGQVTPKKKKYFFLNLRFSMLNKIQSIRILKDIILQDIPKYKCRITSLDFSRRKSKGRCIVKKMSLHSPPHPLSGLA